MKLRRVDRTLAAAFAVGLPGGTPDTRAGLDVKRKLLNGIRLVAGPLMVLMISALASPGLSADLNPKQVGTYVANWKSKSASISSIAVSGERAYVTCSDFDDSTVTWVHSLLILNITNPQSPTLLGRLNLPMPWKVIVRGNYAYITAGEDGLVIIDVTNPAAPRRVGSAPTHYATGFSLSGNYAYVADGDAGLSVIDVSNPVSPRRVAGLDGCGEVPDVFVSGNYAYVADRFSDDFKSPPGALRIVDIRNPANPQMVAVYPVEGQAWSVGVVGNTAYVGGEEFEIFDVSDPANSLQVGTYGGVTWWGGTMPGDRAYVNAGGLIVLDISNPLSPRRLGGYPAEGVVSGRYAYVKIPGGLGIIDLDQTANLPRVGGLDTPGNASAVAISGNRAFIADGNAGLQVIDIADPAKPVLLGNYPTSQPARSVAAAGTYACVVESWGTGGGASATLLEVVDASDAAAPQSVGSYATSGWLGWGSFAEAGGHAYLGLYENSSSRVEVIDLNAPANPQQVAVYDNIGDFGDFTASGHQLFLATQAGLLVLDVSETNNPQPLGVYTDTNLLYPRITVSGTRAYLAGNAGGGFQVLDLSDPMHPSLIGSNPEIGSGWQGLAVSGNYVYGAAGGGGVQVVDVANPASPRLVGGNSAVWANAVFVSRTNLFVAGGVEGLQVFEVALTSPHTPPMLTTIRSGSTLTIAWPASVTGAVLESTSQLSSAAIWSPLTEAPVVVGEQNVVTTSIGAGSSFFRLKLQ